MPFDIMEATAALRDYRPVPWDQIPDLGLYMDQVVTFIARTYAPLYGEDARRSLSPAMINNYVKARLIPRPVGKKYSQDQLALLIMIVTLKQVSSMDAIRQMLVLPDEGGAEALYAAFCHRFGMALRSICAAGESVGPLHTAMDYAIVASAYSAASAAVLKAMAESGGASPS